MCILCGMYKPLEMELLADGDDDHDDVDCLNVCVCESKCIACMQKCVCHYWYKFAFWLGAAGMCGFCSGKEWRERESLNVGIYVVVVVVAVGIKLLIFDKDPHLMPFALLFSFSLLRTREVE